MKPLFSFGRGALLHAAIALGLASFTRAAVVADYQFTAGSAANTAASGLASAGNITFPFGSISSSSSQFFVASTNDTPDSLSLAITGNFYLTFTVTPTAGAINFTSLAFAFGLTNNTSTVNPYTGNWAVLTSVTGFTAGQEIQSGNFSLPNNSGAGGTFVSPSPDVSLASTGALQNVSGPTEFRLYYWDNTAVTNSQLIIRFDSVQLNAVAVPEPSSFALAGFAAAGLLWSARRRLAPRA